MAARSRPVRCPTGTARKSRNDVVVDCTGKQALMPSWFGGGCLGWMIVIIMWCVIAVVFPIVIIGWMIILGGVFAAFGGGGGDG
jgi:hypothetical protein